MEEEREREYQKVEEGDHIFVTRLYEEERGGQIVSGFSFIFPFPLFVMIM